MLRAYGGVNGICCPRMETLAADIGRQRRAVVSAIRTLCAKGLVSRRRRPGSSNAYTVHLDGNGQPTTQPGVSPAAQVCAADRARGCAADDAHNKTYEQNTQQWEAIKDYWNSHVRKPIGGIRELTPARLDALKRCMRNSTFAAGWAESIDRVMASDLCRGQRPGIGWVITFDQWCGAGDHGFGPKKTPKWLMALEGNYDTHKREGGYIPPDKTDE